MSRDEGQFKNAPPSVRAPARRTGVGTALDPEAERRELTALSERYGIPALDLTQVSFPLSNLELIPLEIARRHVILPILVREDAIFLAMAEPNERRVIEELEFVSGKRVFPYVAQGQRLAALIEHAYDARQRGQEHYVGPAAQVTAAPAPTQPQAVAMPQTAPPVFGATPAGSLPGVIARPSGIEALDPRTLDLDGDELADPDLSVSLASSSTPAGGPTLDSVFGPIETLRGHTVLVVDDEEDIRKLLRRVLEDKGYRVLEADRGSVALNMVKQHVPDGIILDAMLPELHGFDICRRIKASARYGHIPILMISAVYRGWRFAEDLKASYGVNAYIEKPFRIAEILSAVESMLAGAPKPDARDPDALSAEADAALNAGMEAYKLGNIDMAIAHIERGISLDPLSYRLHYHLALLVGRKGDVFRAIQELETAIDLNPKFFSALKNLAVLYQKAGFKHKAIEMWERAIGQSPDELTRGQIKEHLMSLL